MSGAAGISLQCAGHPLTPLAGVPVVLGSPPSGEVIGPRWGADIHLQLDDCQAAARWAAASTSSCSGAELQWAELSSCYVNRACFPGNKCLTSEAATQLHCRLPARQLQQRAARTLAAWQRGCRSLCSRSVACMVAASAASACCCSNLWPAHRWASKFGYHLWDTWHCFLDTGCCC